MDQKYEYLKIAESMSGRWFSIHSEQRLKLFNFYLVLFAGSLTLLAGSWTRQNYGLLILVGFFLLVITFVFKQLDKRTATLVKKAEFSLNEIEKDLAEFLSPKVRILWEANKKGDSLTYRQAFNVIYILSTIIAFVSILCGVLYFCGCWV